MRRGGYSYENDEEEVRRGGNSYENDEEEVRRGDAVTRTRKKCI